jgi:hypothetical protein
MVGNGNTMSVAAEIIGMFVGRGTTHYPDSGMWDADGVRTGDHARLDP